MMDLAFLASNNGSSLRAIVASIRTGELAACPRLVVSNRKTAPALDFARAEGIEARFIPTVPDADVADARLAETLTASGAELVVLSGYLRKLGRRTLEAFQGRILNIHPALLPKFGGQGMYGRKVHEAVIAAGETVSGITIHLVDEEYDHGKIIAQREVPVLPGDSVDDLQQRITQAEPPFFVDVLKSLSKP